MESYKNLSGDSPILGYEIGTGFIKIWFKGNPTPYRYAHHVAELGRLAIRGQGLSTFINQHKQELPFTRG